MSNPINWENGPSRISILRDSDKCGWTVIADGRITESLAWDEMLGHIARITLGHAGYHSLLPGELPFWKRPKGLLKES